MYKFMVISACFIFIAQTAYAHPPSDINLTYNQSSQDFTLIISHRIAVKGHFISKVAVTLNGEEIESKTYPFQQNKYVVSFSFPAEKYEKGAIISIEATCNRTGASAKDFSIDSLLGETHPDKNAAK